MTVPFARVRTDGSCDVPDELENARTTMALDNFEHNLIVRVATFGGECIAHEKIRADFMYGFF